MNVLLVSQCTKNALKESRRILDQFAERRGDRTWQTAITWEGLDTLRRLLRKTARKNTAVACHWIRGRDHSELLWIVGNAAGFNAEGATPTDTTRRDILRTQDENDWHSGDDIYLLAALAALLHDIGKACQAFQERLSKTTLERNLYRHEWISLRLFEAFVGDDDDEGWLRRLQDPQPRDNAAWIGQLRKDLPSEPASSPFERLPPLAAAIGWLVVTHHRLPEPPPNETITAEMLNSMLPRVRSDWNQTLGEVSDEAAKPYWTFPHGLSVTTEPWRRRAARLAGRLLERGAHRKTDWLGNAFVMHLARLSLMLGDHYYSSLKESNHPDRVKGADDHPLFANTDRKTGKLNQRLDEHLLGVEKQACKVTRALPLLDEQLPRLSNSRPLRRRTRNQRFRWQDKAFDLAAGLRERSRRHGFFGVNMASTGYGKTLANGRIFYALARPEQGARFSIALGLRTLTLQTGRSYRKDLGLRDDQLAVRVGGGASRTLYEHYQEQAEASGSESRQDLLPEDSYVHFEGAFESHPLFRPMQQDRNVKALVDAPILACTVDHLAPANEGKRGGRQIAPMLRLMTADLVLDELDDFDLTNLPALTRLVHWTGMLGSRVLLSSATLPPSLVEGLFQAYRAGREQYQHNRGEPGTPLEICCAWFDEHDQVHEDCADIATFAAAHRRFAERRHARLGNAEIRRRAQLVPVSRGGQGHEQIRAAFAEQVRDQALALHQKHAGTDPASGKRVSFGLIRMANIEPLYDVALALYALGAPAGTRIHLCVYHSQYPLLLRSAIEHRLDQTLMRADEDAVYRLPDIRARLDAHSEPDQVFIVLGSPVTEVGRDHDYDWAVVEPSSMRSLIQLAGRVRRHRPGECASPNIALLDTNIRSLERPNEPAFLRPGFESHDFPLDTHTLEQLLLPEQRDVIDARPRILEPAPLAPRLRLVDLEHQRTRITMCPESSPDAGRRRRRGRRQSPLLGAYSWWIAPETQLTGFLQRKQPFRYDPKENVELVLYPDEDEEGVVLMRVETGQRDRPLREVDNLLTRIPDSALQSDGITPWGDIDYLDALTQLAEERDLSLRDCAWHFGGLTLPASQFGWRFHPALGFSKER